MRVRLTRDERGVTLVEAAILVSLVAVVAAMGVYSLGFETQRPFCEVQTPMVMDMMELSYDQHLQYSGGSAFRANAIRQMDGKRGDCMVSVAASAQGSVSIWSVVSWP